MKILYKKSKNYFEFKDREYYKNQEIISIIEKAIMPYFIDLKKEGIKRKLSRILKDTDVNQVILKKIRKHLSPCRSVNLGRRAGMAMIQYRCAGVQIEPVGIARWIIKRITITDRQIIESIDNILEQIQEKYVCNSDYIIKKIDDILVILSNRGIYKPETPEEKTLYDVILLMLLNYRNMPDETPAWVEQAVDNMERADFVEELVGLVIEQISSFVSEISKNLFLDFKVTFDSLILRTFLNKKTNRGQISEILKMMNINIRDIINGIAEDYMSPSFIKGAGELIGDIADTFLCDISKTGDQTIKIDNICPFKITISAFGDNLIGRAFRWYTRDKTDKSFIEYSDSKEFINPIRIESKMSYVSKSRPTLNLGVIMSYSIYHEYKYSAFITDLEPGKEYYYRVGCPECWSEVYKFRVACPERETKFTIFADSQGMTKNDYEIFLNVFHNSISKCGKPDFVVHMGDFVDDGNNEDYWDWILESDLWRKNAVIPLAGNHEAKFSPSAYKAGVENSITSHFYINADSSYYSSPSGPYYSYRYGDATFIVLNTNDMDDEGRLSREQYSWAEKTAKSARTKWKILFTHKSPYSNGPHHNDSDVKSIGEQIIDLAYIGDIDLVIGGHDHVYVRTPVMSAGKEINCKEGKMNFEGERYEIFENPYGTIFVVPGTSGVKNYRQNMSDIFPNRVMKDLDLPVYSQIKIKDNILYFNAYSFNEKTNQVKVIDRFCISKEGEKNTGGKLCRIIDSIAERPYEQNINKINKARDIYNSLDYFERLKVSNYGKLLKTSKMCSGYMSIMSKGIETVKNKSEFILALKNQDVSTIIINCDEIKFETAWGRESSYIVERNMCIRGNARLSLITFKIKKGVCFVIDDNICIDNTRRTFSPYKSLNCIEVYDGSVLVVNGNSSIRCGYGIGTGGYGVLIRSTGGHVYFNSKSHHIADKNIVYTSSPSSGVTVNFGKYTSRYWKEAFNIDGSLFINNGEISGIKSGENSSVFVNGGHISVMDNGRRNTAIKCSGKLYISGGKISSKYDMIVAKGENSGIYIRPYHNGAVTIGDKVIYLGSVDSIDEGYVKVNICPKCNTYLNNTGLYVYLNRDEYRSALSPCHRRIFKEIKTSGILNIDNTQGYLFIKSKYRTPEKIGIICSKDTECFVSSRATFVGAYKNNGGYTSEKI